jgi:hypothetical protein
VILSSRAFAHQYRSRRLRNFAVIVIAFVIVPTARSHGGRLKRDPVSVESGIGNGFTTASDALATFSPHHLRRVYRRKLGSRPPPLTRAERSVYTEAVRHLSHAFDHIPRQQRGCRSLDMLDFT